MKTRSTTGVSALTMVEVLLLACVIAVLILLLLPMMARSNARSSRINCVNNLKQVGLAFRIWAGDYGDRFPMRVATNQGGTMELVSLGNAFPHFQVLSNELNTPKVVVCPQDPRRHYATNFGAAFGNMHVSYFVGLDADETQPQMWLSGDSNLEVKGKTIRPGLLNLWTNSPVVWTAERHNRQGNLCFADGSVQQLPYGNASLRGALAGTGVATNRLAIP